VSLARVLIRLKLALVRHGPNAERGFGLVAGGVFALILIGLGYFVGTGKVDDAWLLIALSAWGLVWFFGPLIQPTFATAAIHEEWFRTLPYAPSRIAKALGTVEIMGVGSVITAIAFCSLVFIAHLTSGLAILLVGLVILAQVYFLLWLGKATAAVVRYFMSGRFGREIAATQMSILLAISFVGWVPIAAVFLPKLGVGSSEVAHVSISQELFSGLETMLLHLPTGWGVQAIQALNAGSISEAVYYIVALLGIGIVCWFTWWRITTASLWRPSVRPESGVRVRRPFFPVLPVLPLPPQIQASYKREMNTWFRDPVRSLELRHAWLTPLFMAIIVGFSGWSWALPFIGVAFASFGAMVAVNSYALDGTAFWQLMVTPKAPTADLRGRQVAWLILFGLPAIVLTLVVSWVTQSPLSTLAIGMAVLSVGIAAFLSPLLALLMPAFGLDARFRVRTGQRAGDPTGAQMTVFSAVLLCSTVPIALLNTLLSSVMVLFSACAMAIVLAWMLDRLAQAWIAKNMLVFFSRLKAGK
jgi:ABC-2 type transport system permease protein